MKYKISAAIGSWAEANKGVYICTKSNISSDSTAQSTFHIGRKGIDMSPIPKPRKKENHEEIPPPGSPGLPVPVFPDVAIPFVPELPSPEVPEFPMPQEPGKAPNRDPLPGEPRTYQPGSHAAKCSVQAANDKNIDILYLRFALPWEQKAAGCVPKSNWEDTSSKCICETCQKYSVFDGLMITAMFVRNRNNCLLPSRRHRELLPIESVLTSTVIQDILSLVKGQKRARTRIHTMAHGGYAFGMTFEQVKQLNIILSKLQGQVQHPKVVVNRISNKHTE